MAANWLPREGNNPFNLQPPPKWWLTQLGFFDPNLVVFPSCKEAKYRLAERVMNSPGLQSIGILHKHPDTTFMAEHRLLPVISFLPTIEWTTEIFTMLRLMDIPAHGGADKVADQLDAAGDARESKIQRGFESDVNDLSADAYRAAKMRMGQRTFVSDNAPSRSSETPPVGNG